MMTSWMTVRKVLETGLRNLPSKPFQLKPCTVKGKGPARRESWANLRARIYEGRGA